MGSIPIPVRWLRSKNCLFLDKYGYMILEIKSYDYFLFCLRMSIFYEVLLLHLGKDQDNFTDPERLRQEETHGTV